MSFPIHPPKEWFSPPPSIPTDRRLTIEGDGRVYGYIALWDQCHAGASGCVRPPKGSPTGYEYAHQGYTLTDEGEQIRTAVIAGGTVHASASLKNLQVPEHYENTGNQMMRVRYGEDENGIWFAGAVWPDLDELMIEKLRASSISGDWRFSAGWRNIQDNEYDFAGACLVNIPGFPTPTDENSVYKRAGQAYGLVASAVQTNVDIILVDDIYTSFDENYPCDAITAGWLPEGMSQGDLSDGDFAWISDAYKNGKESKTDGRKLPYKINGKVNADGWRAAWNMASKTDLSGGPSLEEVRKKLLADKPEGIEVDKNISAAATTEGSDAVSDEAASTDETPTNETPTEVDVLMGVNMKLEEIVTRINALEGMVSQAEAERLLQQVIQNREQ